MVSSESLRGGENPSRAWGKPVGQHDSLSSSNSRYGSLVKNRIYQHRSFEDKLDRKDLLTLALN